MEGWEREEGPDGEAGEQGGEEMGRENLVHTIISKSRLCKVVLSQLICCQFFGRREARSAGSPTTAEMLRNNSLYRCGTLHCILLMVLACSWKSGFTLKVNRKSRGPE